MTYLNPDFATYSKEAQEALTPNQAFEMLVEGNLRFVENRTLTRNLKEEMDVTEKGQLPFATVLSCIDSRVSSELIFDQGFGDLFSIRIAGNILNEDIVGSMEFATKLAGTKIVVVLGHTKCGAITGACSDVKLGSLTTLLEKVKPAILAETETTSNRDGSNPTFVKNVIEKNVHVVISQIRERSEVIRDLEASNQIKIVGGIHDIATGLVTFYE